MSPLRALATLLLTLPTAQAVVGPNDVYQESGGIVVMEAERTPSSLGTGGNRWERYEPGDTNYVEGATNGAHIEFQGNSSNGGPPTTPLTYKFKIHEAGYYHLHLRARARLDGAESDKNNDCYVKVTGDPYGPGPNAGNDHLDDATLALLTSDTKMYGASPTTWGWANELDAGGNTNKRFPVYNFQAGGTYTLTISGRSIKYNIDRIVFRKSTISASSARSASIPESSTVAGGPATQAVAALTLVNADTDQDIGPITDGMVINLAVTGSSLNVRADTNPPIVGSVRFSLDGAPDSMTQTGVPYTLGGDAAGDDYLPWTPALGVRTLTATPFTAAAATGTAGTPLTVSFTVINTPPSGTPLANAGTDKSITLPTSSAVLNGSGTDTGGAITAYAWTQVSGPSTATLSGNASANLTASALVAGTYVFRLTVTDNSGLSASDDATVTVQPAAGGSGQSVATLMLIDADTDSDIGPIVEGAVIDLAVTGRNLNIRADTSPASVGSVRFSLNAVENYATQSGAPYTIGGDSLTDYWPWTPPLGALTLTATPFTASGGTGTPGTAKTVSFTVIDSQLSGDPVAIAGPDKAVVLPAGTVVFNGSGSDGDGSITGYAWTQVSGPASAILSGSATATLTASALVEGSYVFRLTVTDNSGKTASDDVALTVFPAGTGSAAITGELRKWHKVTLSFTGPSTSETATPNPFTDYRLNITFTHVASGKSYLIPGYFAADGNAANSSAAAGNVWRAHFAPDETGAWTYTASFRSGSNIATSTAAGTSAGHFDGDSGSFNVAATDKAGRDFRGKGRLQYVGKHHLRFAETGEYFMKAGVDAPENLLAYQDFDGDFKTDGQKDELVKSWAPHAADWQSGDPVWQGTKGKGLIGAINYLAAEGLNAFSFLTMNINGDDRNVFPYTGYSERSRFDVSKLDQWEIIFEHGTRQGMYLHFKTQETENQGLLDGGSLGNQRKLYYRELIARFAHHPALNWNLGEECTASLANKQAWAQYFHDTDPYRNHLVIHNGSDHRNMMGDASKLTGFSLQLNASDFTDMFAMTKDYVDRSEDADKPWVVACDEPGDSRLSLRPDNDAASSHVDARKNALWGNIMAGGAGVEWYFGYDKPHSDLTCQDFRSRDSFWDVCRHALQFLTGNAVPFEQMRNQNPLVSGYGNNANRCLAKTGHTYLVQLHGGGTHTLNLSGTAGNFTVKWFDPRNGGTLINGPTVSGGGTVSLGAPPNNTSQDWIALVQTTSAGGGATNQPPVVSAGADKSAFLSGASVQVSLTGSVTDDGLPDGSLVSRSWSQVSGPATVTFSSTTTATTTATFTTLGTYVLRFSGSDSALSASDDVTVTIQAPAGTGSRSFAATHDAYTENGSNFNTTQLRVESSGTRSRIAFLQFDLSSLTGPPTSALLRLTEGDDVSSGSMTLRLYAASSSSWTESTINSANDPAKGALLDTFTGDVTDGRVLEFNVASHVTGPGIYSFILEADPSTRDVSFASDENTAAATRPVLITGTNGNADPVFPGFSITTEMNQPVLVPFTLLLASATDPDGDPVSVADADTASAMGATVALAADSFTYTPVIDFSGQDSFSVTVQDGRGGFATATVTIQVLGSDGIAGFDPPVLERLSGNQIRLGFHGQPGTAYAFQRSTDLVGWTTLETKNAGVDGSVSFTDATPPAGRAYYRLATP
jgi:hypothetical protein